MAAFGSHLYRPKRSFGQGNIFTSVCHSFCSGGGGWSRWGLVPGRVSGPRGSQNFRGGLKIFGWRVSKFSGGLQFFEGGVSAGLRSTFGRYASYWNAFLFYILFYRIGGGMAPLGPLPPDPLLAVVLLSHDRLQRNDLGIFLRKKPT